jgi:protein-arginine kinase activator protein McsA
MGTCEYCGKQEAKIEIVDDDMDTGVAMVCFSCAEKEGKLALFQAHSCVKELAQTAQRIYGNGTCVNS